MKKFYMLMIALFAMLIGATGCGEADPAPEYGVPVNDNEYGIPYTDYDIDTTDADTEEVPDAEYEGRVMEIDTFPWSSMGQHFWSFSEVSLRILLENNG
ncbi:hypothetical protein KA996_02655, partial [bacterium]|nr:hypothetical protein [bacterium]